MKKTTNSAQLKSDVQAESMQPKTRWITDPVTDIAMVLCWVPFSLFAFSIDDQAFLVQTLMVSVFFLSFAHQPLTLVLVYGDPNRFELRRKLFTWSPLFFAAAIAVALNIDIIVLAVFAGLWNVEHTLMQRYGITRIYGRMVGQKEGGIELCMLFSWLMLALISAAADPNTPDRVSTLGMVGANRSAFELLASLQSVAETVMPIALGIVIIFAIKWLLEETRRGVNRAKHFYLASTAILFVVMLVHPIAGFIGYVGSHALEYFIIVNRSLSTQYSNSGGGLVGKSVRARTGRIGFFAVYFLVVLTVTVMLETLASIFLYSMVFFTLGALHFFYDGFIWKLRQATVARSVGAE